MFLISIISYEAFFVVCLNNFFECITA